MSRLLDDASNQYLENGNAAVSGYPLTIGSWIFPDVTDINHIPLALGCTTQNSEVFVDCRTSGVPTPRFRAGVRYRFGFGCAEATTGYTANVWQHICGVFTSATLRAIFMDGGNKGTNATSINFDSAIDRTLVGATRNSVGGVTAYFSGRVALPAIWDCALHDAEVLWLAQGNWPHRVRPSNFCGYWLPPGIRNDYDYSGRGYHMTPYNSPTWAADPPKVLKLR